MSQIVLRIVDMYMVLKHMKIGPPLHVGLNNCVAIQIFKRSSSNRAIEANVQLGSDFHVF